MKHFTLRDDLRRVVLVGGFYCGHVCRDPFLAQLSFPDAASLFSRGLPLGHLLSQPRERLGFAVGLHLLRRRPCSRDLANPTTHRRPPVALSPVAGVTIIDADPNRPVSRWAKRPGKPEGLAVIDDVVEETIIDRIEEAARACSFVIVDLEGTASMMVGCAVSRADLVIIPTQGSQLDAAEAVKAIKLVRNMKKARDGKPIPTAVLFTRASAAIKPRTLASIEAEFRGGGVRVRDTHMRERDAFSRHLLVRRRACRSRRRGGR